MPADLSDAQMYRQLAVIAQRASESLNGEPTEQLRSLQAWLKDHEPATLGDCPVPDCPGKIHTYQRTRFICDGRGHIFEEFHAL